MNEICIQCTLTLKEENGFLNVSVFKHAHKGYTTFDSAPQWGLFARARVPSIWTLSYSRLSTTLPEVINR